MRVLVTGAGGFVGRALCALLARRAIACRAAVREGVAQGVADCVAIGNIGAQTDWSGALADCSAVVHLANLAHARAGAAELQAVNVDGTRRLAEQAAAAGARRFVYLSSVKALCDETTGGPVTEDLLPEPADDYGRSKLAAERALAEVAARSGLAAVVLRPPLVYGPGVKANFLALLRALDHGWPLPLACVRNRRSLIGVGNLADAIVRCLESPQAAGRTWFVTDGAPVATPELVRALASALGHPARLFPFPPRLLELAGSFAGRAETVKRLTRSLEIDDSAIRRALGWTAPFSFEEGISFTSQWFREESSG